MPATGSAREPAVTRAWQRLSLRARLLTIGVLGVATALAVGSVTLYTVLTVASYRSLDEAGAATAAGVASLAAEGRLPDPIPVSGSQVVQVVDGRDRVVGASVDADRLTAMLLPREVALARSGSAVEVPGSRLGSASPLRVVAAPVGSARQRRTVLVAQPFDAVRHSQRILAVTLLASYPLLLLVLALIAWRVVGAALRPVEALRSSAERISGTGEGVRLEVPASRDEVHALAITLNSMLDRLAASRARQRSFVADAAHELRSPLTSMQTQLEVADRLGEGTDVTADLLEEVLRMRRLVEDLLVLARLDADRAPSAPAETFAVGPLVTEVLQRHRDARVEVVAAPDQPGPPGDGPLVVLGRRDELQRALANLVDNAVRHAAHRVEVRAYDDGPGVVVEVVDDGAGIAEEDRDRVFERFTRLDEARDRDAGGSGLGLAIVRELVQRNGGRVHLGTAPGGGLSARIRLPAP